MKKALADALEKRGYTTLTPVQVEVTKPELTGSDLLVSAQTGSGKTLGFGLAIASSILGEDEGFAPASTPLALIIAPTRELALQVKRELSWLYAEAGAVVASCVGGMDMRDERRSLARGAHIVVATPGRLRDHIMRSSIDLSAIQAVVLDEADEMLDLGFREDLEFILGEAPEDRQTLMFSATVPAAIAKLAKSYQKDAVRVTTTAEKSQHADIEYQAMTVAAHDAENAIINVLRFYEAPNAIVFGNTRAMVNRLTTRLSNRGFPVVALSGELSQSERTHALQAMRDGRARVCVATDVAARGIDLPNLDLVVHAELPTNHETLLHRSGRTGRAGRKGVSALIVPPAARKKAQRILSQAKLTAKWSDAPSADAVRAQDEDRMLADPSWHQEISNQESASVEKLVEKFSNEQIAAAYLRLYASRHSAPEDLSTAPEKPAPRAAFGPSVWFSVAGGRADNAEPRRLLPMVCKAGGITKEAVGAIRIQQEASFVEIREADALRFMEKIGDPMRIEGAEVKKLDQPPSDTRGPKQHRGKPVPDRGKSGKPGAARKAPKSETGAPIDWNDAPEPKSKKPKKPAFKGSPKHAKAKPKSIAEPFKAKPGGKRAAPNRDRTGDAKPDGARKSDGKGKGKKPFARKKPGGKFDPRDPKSRGPRKPKPKS